jgi:four helix bundle protein
MSTNSKEAFIEVMKARIKQIAVEIIKFCETLKACNASDVITSQLVKLSTSTGANYRAACRARSRKKFLVKCALWSKKSMSHNADWE